MDSEQARTELEEVVQLIGKARSERDFESLEILRNRRHSLEIELSEIDAEKSYLAKVSNDEIAQKKTVLLGKAIEEYELSESKFLDSQRRIQTTITRFNNLSEILKTQIDSFTKINPLAILQNIWTELSLDQQEKLQKQFASAYKKPDSLGNIDVHKSMDLLGLHQQKLLHNTARLKVETPVTGPKFVGGKSTTRKAAESEIPFDRKFTPKQLETVVTNRNRPLVPDGRKTRMNMR